MEDMAKMATRHFFSRTMLLWFGIVLPLGGLWAGGSEFSGYYKNFNVLMHQREALQPQGGPDLLGLSVNRVRLQGEHAFSADMSLHAAYSLATHIRDDAFVESQVFLTGPSPRQYRARDFANRLYPENTSRGSFGLYHNLDRAYLSWALPFADLYLGRQVIAWGSARVINPTDIIAPYTFEELDTEERVGVDALRVRIPFGFMSELDLGYVAGEDFALNRSALYLRGKTYLAQTDVSLLLMYFREHLMAGVDLARAIGGAGAWLETAYVLAEPFERSFLGSTGNDYFRGTAGVDYSLSDRMYGFVEVHYSTAGVERYQDYYFNIIQHPAYSDGSTYLLGQKYVMPGFSFQITPLITLNTQVVYNVDDRSTFLGPTLEYNIAQNIYLGGGAFLGIGPGPERVHTVEDYILLHSEFGTYPNVFYTNFRIYF